MQKMMNMMRGGNQKKLVRQMEAMKGRGGSLGMCVAPLAQSLRYCSRAGPQ